MTLLFQLVHHVAEGAVHDGIGFLVVCKEERQVEDAERRDEANERRGRCHNGFLNAGAQGLRCLKVTAESAAPECRQLQLAARLVVEAGLHGLDAVADGVILVDAVRNTDVTAVEFGHCRSCGANGESDGRGSQKKLSHNILPWIMFEKQVAD